jgi:hypothetical protein
MFEKRCITYEGGVMGVIKLRRVRWTGHVARIGRRSSHRILVRKPKGRYHLENLGVERMIILKCILK